MSTEALHESIDELHLPPDDDHPFVTETAWYSFWTTDKAFIGHVYLRFRPNLGTMDCFVYVWGSGGSVPWDAAYWKDLRLGIPATLEDLVVHGLLHHEVRRPFEDYHLSYHDDRQYGGLFAFDLDVAALRPATYFGGKHFDQSVRVTGTLTLDGLERQVDCLAMRDRSWYRRGDFTQFRSAYSYALTSPTEGFLALYAAPRDVDMLVDDLPLVGGHQIVGDVQTPLISGERRVTERDAATGQPEVVEITFGVGAERRTVVGTVRNSMALVANTNMMSWMSLVDWNVDGTTIVGEDQEIWSPGIWRAFRQGSAG
jgi:hypothetical protein